MVSRRAFPQVARTSSRKRSGLAERTAVGAEGVTKGGLKHFYGKQRSIRQWGLLMCFFGRLGAKTSNNLLLDALMDEPEDTELQRWWLVLEALLKS